MPKYPTPKRYLLSVGGGALRLWERQRGLIAEIPPCVVVDRETGELKLYGEEAAALEGKTPPHLEFTRVWSGDKIIDRNLLRSLLQTLLVTETTSWWERWQRSVQTTCILPETVSPLHLRWLRKTLREAGWWLTPTLPMAQSFLQRRKRPASLVQSVLDMGFTSTRFMVIVGDEAVLAVTEPQYSLQAFSQALADYLLAKHDVEVSPAVFYDQLWQQTRYVFHRGSQKPQQYAPTTQDLKVVTQQFQKSLGQWLERQLHQLTETQQAELQRQGAWVLGGAAEVLDIEADVWPLPLRRSHDARYAVLRALSKTG